MFEVGRLRLPTPGFYVLRKTPLGTGTTKVPASTMGLYLNIPLL